MIKIMLVIDNDAERDFLHKILERLRFDVIAMVKGSLLAEQLLDHFPDVVFASTLGKNQKILSALAKIKEARGKPKVVFVRQEREAKPLNDDQKKVIDSVLYSPIDPFKLLEVLNVVTGVPLPELRRLYNDMLSGKEKKEESGKVIETIGDQAEDEAKSPKVIQGGVSLKKEESVLIIDYGRRKKYQDICNQLKDSHKDVKPMDTKKLRDLQKQQKDKLEEDSDVKKNRKHFLNTLFSMDPQKKAD